ncbi:cation diffusion facilitator family transporter [Aerococcus sp. 150760007-1]|uniref:Cation transporter n=1 Tax=Aerococcus urinaeequi TaxID=51665 RepID=A0ABR5ZZD2_9LACT|nr:MULTISPECIES: cation diffusion facilitator family transporter [Lactobacillales]KAF3304715.1 cation diffusion facilitator family transporter [Carnobacterium sp. PL17GRE32]MBA5747094.1 cation transporter [Aerococcus urinaeequi]MBA5829878.1 cation transporter [Aerococcus urinaeequi]MBA5860486.1 cation transporter [Aerococcus urinaeequi]HCT97533.1 transporter [Aerococcus urinaeequi]
MENEPNMTPSNTNQQIARRGIYLSIVTYVIISTAKLLVGYSFDSDAVFADGLNNFTDSFASIALLVGMILSQRPADQNHRYGHYKIETITTLIMSFVIFYIGITVTIDSTTALINQAYAAPTPINAVVGLSSGVIMSGVYWYNNRLGNKLNSPSLKASAKDNLSDALTSFATALSVFLSRTGILWLDGAMAIVVGLIIIKSGYDIFKESAFSLSDGFPQEGLDNYRKIVLMVPGVRAVSDIRGRNYGANVYIDITILVDPEISVQAGHHITEKVESALQKTEDVTAIDVHVEPYQEN